MCNKPIGATASGEHQQEHSSSKPPNSDAEEHDDVEMADATNSPLPKSPSARLQTLSPAPLPIHDAELHKVELGTAEDSPFLKLPPELRNRIYAYAVGGLAVHVEDGPYEEDEDEDEGGDEGGHGHGVEGEDERDRDRPIDGKVVRFLCCAEKSDSAIHTVLRKQDHFPITDDGDFDYPDLSSSNHLACNSSQMKFGEVLGLLLVCRQIYREAALLPYSVNTFFLRHFLTLHWLERALQSAQSGALRSLTLQVTFWGARANGRINSSVKSLTGLRHLSVFYEIEPSVILRSVEEQDDAQYQDTLTSGLPLFASLQLESVSVSITQGKALRLFGYDNPMCNCEGTKQWSRRLEKSLLNSESRVDGAAHNEAALSVGTDTGLS